MYDILTSYPDALIGVFFGLLPIPFFIFYIFVAKSTDIKDITRQWIERHKKALREAEERFSRK